MHMIGRERFRFPNFPSVMAGMTHQHLRHDALNTSKGGSEPQVVGRVNLQKPIMSTVKNSCQVPKSQMGPLVSYLAFGFVCSLAVEKVDEQRFFPSRNR